MNKVSKFLTVSSAVVFAGVAVAGSASAQEWHQQSRNGGDMFAAGIAGLAAGIIAGAIVASPPPASRAAQDVNDDDEREYVAPNDDGEDYDSGPRYDRRVYAYRSIQPWTRDWYRSCQDRYDSFDPRSGTYMGYDGEQHFCVVN